MDSLCQEKLERYFPELLDEIESYKDLKYAEVILYLKDGSVLRFDGIENRLKRLPSNMDDMTDEEYKVEFGLRLRRAMAFNRINQDELSYRTGIAQPAISRYITGKTLPTVRILHRITRAIGCTAEDLYYDY